MRTRKTTVSRMSSVCITLLIMLSVGATNDVLADDYAIGGAIYTDLANPLASGEPDVTVTVSGANGTYTGTSSGSMGIWQIDDVPEGTYTVTPAKQGIGFQHLVDGVSDGLSSITITVNAANQAANQSIQFLAGDPAEYSLDVSVTGGHGSVSANPDSSTYLANTQVSLTATPEDGYRVAAWDGIDDGSTAEDLNKATVTMTEDKTVTVEFEEIPPDMYTLTVEQPENGSISISPQASSGVYAEGTIVTLTASPDAGYQVKAWSGTDNAPSVGSATNTVTVTEDITVTVEFEVAFTIGGAIYTDLENPLTSGLGDVTVTVSGAGKTYSTTTNGSQGIWQISNLPEGTYTVTPSAARQILKHVADGAIDSQSSITINVNAANEAGNQSIQFIGIGVPPDNISISKMTIKAGKTRFSRDSLSIFGTSFDAIEADFSMDASIHIAIYNQNEESPVFADDFDVSAGKYRNGKFGYKGSNGRISSFKCDIKRNTFSIKAKRIDLSGLRSPVIVDIAIGDYYATAVAYDGEVLAPGESTDIINGRKPMPMQLLSGIRDSLRVDKCKFKLGTRKASTDTLTVQGAIAVADTSISIGGEDVLVSWGDYDIRLPANDLYQIGSKKAFKYKKPRGSNSSIAAAVFDLAKCKFKIVIKKAEIGDQGNPVDFRIQFGEFDETVTLQLTEKKANYWRFP